MMQLRAFSGLIGLTFCEKDEIAPDKLTEAIHADIFVRIGKLRHRITIEQVTETQDTDGSALESWSTYATVQASIEPISGREYFTAQSTQADVTHRISLRYVSGITPKMRVNFSSRIFDILSVINVNECNRELQLMCRESIG
jgi:SPP1 family predicted phage head-tail adaptor